MPPTKVHSRKRKKRRFTGNQYTRKSNSSTEAAMSKESTEKSDESSGDEEHAARGVKSESFKSLPASVRKLKPPSDDSSKKSSENEGEILQGFRIFDISILATVFESLPCPSCKRVALSLEEDEDAKMGLASLLILKCTGGKCSFTRQFYTSAKIQNKQAFEVNRRAVLAMRNIGVGHQGLEKFTCVMNMLPPMNENAYRDHVKAVRDATESVAKESMSKAANDVKEFYEPNEEGLYDIAVSGDGTWRKRGFSSSYGVVTVLSTVTGKALDCEVMSKECRQCMQWRGKERSAEFHEWWDGHQHECHANFEGSSGSMDASGILNIFQRSVEGHGLRFVEFLGDGDSKAHKLLVQEAVYGDVDIEKLECVGHVQKRLGSRLHSLKKRLGKTPLADGKPIGGAGRLTDKKIDKLQVYFGKAIRQNTHNITAMQNAVMAIWHHSRSTDENPDHDLCPEGEDSWCGFQRDIAKGTADYAHKEPMKEAVATAILPTFEALSEESLLSKCKHGGTQNQNESVNGLIWQRATKETHSNLPTVETATFLGVAHFNDGSTCLISVLKHLGIVPGVHCKRSCAKLDSDRIRHSRRKSGELAKKRRKNIRKWKKGYTDTLEANEGPSY